jgi:hypothetical protein
LSASAPSLKQRTAKPSASSAIDTEVKMFLSSSTRAIVLATDLSPKDLPRPQSPPIRML